MANKQKSESGLRPFGYLYIVTGEAYVQEAMISARSLRNIYPEADISLITDKAVDTDLFTEVIIKPFDASNKREGYLYKVRHQYFDSPYERTFFLDSDTYFCEDCRELFDLLDYYDLLIAHAPNDHYVLEVDGKPLKGYYSYNSGVIVFKRSPANDAFYKIYHDLYEAKLEVYHDQPALMEALLHANVKLYVLQNIYNARTPAMISMMPDTVKLIHGRHTDFEAVRAKINSKRVNRTWIPATETVMYNEKMLNRLKNRSFLHRIYYSLPIGLQDRLKKLRG